MPLPAGDDAGLAQSLGQLSLNAQPHPPPKASRPRPKPAPAPLKLPSRRSSITSSVVSPRPRPPSRSPSNGRESRASRAGTPPLLRKASINSLHSVNGVGPARPAARRSSSSHMAPLSAKSVQLLHQDEDPPATAHTVARDHFRAELAALHGDDESPYQTETIVILNDAVYGHRYSRPRTSRSALSNIVERPERIKAALLGISTAYVRLGGRHCDGTVPIYPKRSVHTLPGIPFRIRKTTRRLPLASPAVTNVHGTKWMDELKLMCDSAEAKLAMGGKELQRPPMLKSGISSPDHGPPQKLHEGDLYLCDESLEAIEGALGAVCEAVDAVFSTRHRRAFVGVRPPGHHCSVSYPSGFCWVNNVHVGIMHGALTQGMTHAAIIDFDLHHGDGSQAIVWQHNARAAAAPKNASAWKKTSIGYFSIHDINSYPCEMGDEEKVKNASLCIDNAHGQAVWNVHLQPWKTEHDFWALYESKYMAIVEKTRGYLRSQAERLTALGQKPKAVIFFSAGFDASEWEGAGMQRHQVNVPTEFYARLSQDVVRLAAEEGLYVDGRVISVLEGGYSDRALFSGILSHISGLVGDQTLKRPVPDTPGTATDMGQRIGAAEADNGAHKGWALASTHPYDASWWTSSELEKLELPIRPPTPPRKPRNVPVPTYSSPTQASTAKVIDPARMRRSLSGISMSKMTDRSPSPPPPEVPWAVAAHELCRLLIPTGRQTDSCKPEDLNAEATKARRDRQSHLMGPPPAPEPPSRPGSRMALRERKARAIGPIDEESNDQPPKTRRKAATPVASPGKTSTHSTPPRQGDAQAARRASRRLSTASTGLGQDREEEIPPAFSMPGGDDAVSRSTSATSSRTHGSGKLAVKKTRAPAVVRNEAAPKARSPKRAAVPARNKAAASAAPGAGPSNDAGVESITAGMKKIKINLITQAQREAKERARLKAEAPPSRPGGGGADGPAAGARETTATWSVEAQPPPSDAAPSVGGRPMQPAAPLSAPDPGAAWPSADPQTPVEETGPPGPQTPDASSFALPASSPAVSGAAEQATGDGGDFFIIPYQPEGPDAVPVCRQEPLKWLPPNVVTPAANTPAATPSAGKKQGSLFHYTSGIPFAPRPATGTPKPEPGSYRGRSEASRPASAWDVADTPQK